LLGSIVGLDRCESKMKQDLCNPPLTLAADAGSAGVG
jgi:hypothetical protein